MPDDLITAALTRIENKLDTVALNHEGRLSSIETTVQDIKEAQHSEEVKSWIKLAGGYVAVMASHLGLSKLGFKI